MKIEKEKYFLLDKCFQSYQKIMIYCQTGEHILDGIIQHNTHLLYLSKGAFFISSCQKNKVSILNQMPFEDHLRETIVSSWEFLRCQSMNGTNMLLSIVQKHLKPTYFYFFDLEQMGFFPT